MTVIHNQKIRRIHIIGSVGSGKTTLARRVSKELTIPYYELDNVVRERLPKGDRRRSEQERDTYLTEIIREESWIIEGVHHKWVDMSFQKADLIILLDTHYLVRIYRIFKRFILQKIGKEASHYKPSFGLLYNMYKWNALFERKSRAEIINLLKQYENKCLIISTSDELYKEKGE